jgi:hypothetical protein
MARKKEAQTSCASPSQDGADALQTGVTSFKSVDSSFAFQNSDSASCLGFVVKSIKPLLLMLNLISPCSLTTITPKKVAG